MVIFDQIVVKSSPGLISPSFSGQFFITRVTATPGFKILDGHVHYQSLDKTDNMSDCQLTIKETRYSTLIKLRNVQILKITRLAESSPIFGLKLSETMIFFIVQLKISFKEWLKYELWKSFEISNVNADLAVSLNWRPISKFFRLGFSGVKIGI